MTDNIPELKIETSEENKDGTILLEQDMFGTTNRVLIHPVHARFIFEKIGLAPTSDPQAHKVIASLSRRLQVLRQRSECLAGYLKGNLDLSYAQTYAIASAEIAEQFCVDLDQAEQAEQAEQAKQGIAHV